MADGDSITILNITARDYYAYSYDNSIINTSTSYKTNVSIIENNNLNNNSTLINNRNKIFHSNIMNKFNNLDLESSLGQNFYVNDLN